jgi:hypothetical protein
MGGTILTKEQYKKFWLADKAICAWNKAVGCEWLIGCLGG